ncbi:MAG: hypothetical protein P8L86_03340 [Gammaproteobacteria bacterium]|jgi:predicted small lipoprotein YifL|nr:hypothetical protein [Gammaproteobacteria bacterium]
MNTIIKLSALILVVVGLSSCGKMGELEPVRAEAVASVYVDIHQA